MIKITQYIPLHLSFFLVLGVLTGYYLSISFTSIIYSGLGSIVLLGLFYLLTKKHFQLRWVFQTLTYIIIFLIGITSVLLGNKTNQKTHYSYYILEQNKLVFEVVKKLKPTLYHNKYYANIIQVDNMPTKGMVLINISKDSSATALTVGDTYLTTSVLSDIDKPLNPYSFDYNNYLRKQGIHHQISLKKHELFMLSYKRKSLKSYASRWREKIQNSLEKYSFNESEMAIINAIVLGQRQSISKSLLNSYAGAGAIHILAVSGLHIGILFLLMGFVLKPIEKVPKGKLIKTLLIVVFLWGYALLTGLSASVTRAVTMFTFIAIGLAVRNQRSTVLHALITSFFILVLIHPHYLFNVGFQMSYSAVLGIASLYPKLHSSIPRIKWFILRKIWDLFCVSVTATVGTLPISLYYFHQFPGLFFVSNIVIVPFLGIIMGMGLLVVILALLGVLPELLVQTYGFILSTMNSFIEWIAHQEAFLFKNISFSIFALAASYLIIAMGYRWVIDKKASKLLVVLLAILVLQTVFFIEKYQTETTDELVIFHKSKESILGIKKATEFQIFHSIDSIENKKINIINNYRVGNNLGMPHLIKETPNILKYKNLKLLLIDSLGIYKDISFKPDIIVLQQSPQINLERVLQKHKPDLLIADGSNYKSCVEQWEKTCLKNNVKFHYTGKHGAFVLKK